MRPILLVRNDPVETFGVAPRALEEAGAPASVWDAVDPDAPRPAVDAVSGIVVFGSTSNVEHADERPFIKEVADVAREAVDRGVPVLGVCFGAQLLAWALDADVRKAPVREIGFEPLHPTEAAAEDRLLSHYSDGDMVFQWHMDTFDLPPGAELLGTGDGVLHQAYRVGDAAWALQFHLEIDGAEVEMWLDEFSRYGDLERDWGKSTDRVRDEAHRYLRAHEVKGAEVFRRFAEVARERS